MRPKNQLGWLNPLKCQWCQTVTLKSLQRHPGVTYAHFFISDIRALWRSALSARVPEYQKLKMYVRPGWQSVTS